ncbi:DUF1345 domain-containing protein [Aureimonas sp. Leaf324]|uniref:DUF1345 domain-containing protein n=1 Tax=Aureimonas sp. Leaf324 TaxID=1736336 RepID=UPI0006F5FEDE|nr:DUF1345 domain-containing protein [Aureimonas sp. Leaf324]KQQ80679.1 hypothetical protein ASF65_10680 [Aureimonas sp. Leaf324]
MSDKPGSHTFHRAFIRGVRARPRLLIAAGVAIALALLSPRSLDLSTRILIGWDAGVLFYLGVIARIMVKAADAGDLRRRARRQDEGRRAILLLTGLAIAASFGAIAAELHGIGDHNPNPWRLSLAGFTILLSWVVTQVMMALHYAGEFYGRPNAEGGLDFPGGDKTPGYGDFLYFAFTMGAACQTSDVAVTTKGMRELVLAHTILAFLFNTTVLALAVNVGASVI